MERPNPGNSPISKDGRTEGFVLFNLAVQKAHKRKKRVIASGAPKLAVQVVQEDRREKAWGRESKEKRRFQCKAQGARKRVSAQAFGQGTNVVEVAPRELETNGH